jgi:hypothetical protein
MPEGTRSPVVRENQRSHARRPRLPFLLRAPLVGNEFAGHGCARVSQVTASHQERFAASEGSTRGTMGPTLVEMQERRGPCVTVRCRRPRPSRQRLSLLRRAKGFTIDFTRRSLTGNRAPVESSAERWAHAQGRHGTFSTARVLEVPARP